MTQALKMAAVGAGGVAPTYVDDVFSTYLYTSTGTQQTITNGIDLAGEGGLLWRKRRSAAQQHLLSDTERGAGQFIYSSSASQQSDLSGFEEFNNNGFTDFGITSEESEYASWTFRKAPKFFDVVTWTGNGANRTIAHDLGVAPGCILVKRTDTSGDWQVYHRSLANTDYLVLNSVGASATGATRWNSTTATSSVFSLGTATDVNASGGNYVAYVFAHDAATDGLIQCGSFTTDGSGNATVTLGWEPQWVMLKTTGATGNWQIVDAMRGMVVGGDDQALYANLSSAETAQPTLTPTATGFNATGLLASNSFVYTAIRRPNKPPTVGAEVYSATTRTGDGAGTFTATSGFPVDLHMVGNRTTVPSFAKPTIDRFRSGDLAVFPSTSAAEGSGWADKFDSMTGIVNTAAFSDPALNQSGQGYVDWMFRRAPGFFDIVCDTGNGSTYTIPHNLGVVPELIIRKSRSGATDWVVYCANLANTQRLLLNSTAAVFNGSVAWNSTTPTASVFTVGPNAAANTSGNTYVNYLFATLAGISKVGTYTGNGSSQTINCGFSTGARFVLIKRTDSTGDWYVWDTARGIVSGNDPHLSLNTSAAEVTTDDTIDPDTSGFIVNQVAATNVNVTSATYIYLAIA